jgi:hypothetical protein
MHASIAKVGGWLQGVLRGYYHYPAVPGICQYYLDFGTR